jgi:hypothetical protein
MQFQALLVAAAVLLPSQLAAQCLPLRLPMGGSTRALAMGDANTAGRDDDVIFYDPAQLAVARGTSASFERYSDHLSGGALSASSRIASGGIGVGAQFVSGTNGSQCSVASLGPNGSVIFTPAPLDVERMRAVVGAAQTFKRFHLGASAKYDAEQAGDARTGRLLVDAGVSRNMTLSDFIPLAVGVTVQNIGTRATDTLPLNTPLRAAVGISSGGPVGPVDLAVAADLAAERNGTMSLLRHGRVIAGIGTEIGYEWLDGYSFALRVGERVPPTRTDLRHFTFGAGLVLDRLSFDYAAEDQVGFRLAHRFGVRLR